MNFIFTVLGGIVIFSGKIILFASAPTALVVAALKAYTTYVLQAGTFSIVLTFIGWWCAVGGIIAFIGFIAMLLGYFTIPEEFRNNTSTAKS